MEYYGIAYLKQKLMSKRVRTSLRYAHYEMKNITLDFGISSPPDLRYWQSCLGWCAKAVDALADRLDFRGFTDDVFSLQEIYDLNNGNVLIRSGILGALICACSFVSISEDETGFPRMEVIDGANATGIIDNVTGMLREGYAVLERDIYGQPLREAYYTFEYTAYYEGGRLVDMRPNKATYPLLVPLIYRPDAVRPFGHSRISRACMSIMGSALRTIKRSEISAEFYSFPQKYVTGVDETSDVKFDRWAAAMSAMMKFSLNDDGQDHVKLGQFTQQSMVPHLDQLRMFASLFAGETGLTLDDLGFAGNNPSTAEAIKATHEGIRLTARAAQKDFSAGIINAGYLAACVRDNYKWQRTQLYMTRTQWTPPFPADVSMLGAIGDALGKLGTVKPDYLTDEKIFELTGI